MLYMYMDGLVGMLLQLLYFDLVQRRDYKFTGGFVKDFQLFYSKEYPTAIIIADTPR